LISKARYWRPIAASHSSAVEEAVRHVRSSRPGLLCLEPPGTTAPLAVIDDRFPAVFELRRLFYPKFEELAHSDHIDQGIAGFLDHVQRPNFGAFVEQAEALSGSPVIQVERLGDNGIETKLDDALIDDVDTIVVISFDSFRTTQVAAEVEIRQSGDSSTIPII
jgi:hypothetical protein